MQVFSVECYEQELRLEATIAGWQALFWNNQLVSEQHASASPEPHSVHTFILKKNDGQEISCTLYCELSWQPFSCTYELRINNELVHSEQLQQDSIAKQVPHERPAIKQKFSILGLGSLALKLFKSAKVIKVLLATGSLTAYSWLFSLEFALGLILCLVIHEYGHVRAMKYFGMKTKGIYLIPFIGGLALSENKINTRWQDVVIAIMGPFFGLLLSIISLIIYWLTNVEIFAGLAVYNAILNLFNLLPILPLDGGHILKSITFSMHTIIGLVLCILGAAFGVLISYYFGLALLGFLLAIGSIEILLEWKTRHHNQLLPLDRYGQVISILWYAITIGGLSAIIYIVGQSDNQALSVPLMILGS